jgi:hypothetical protein
MLILTCIIGSLLPARSVVSYAGGSDVNFDATNVLDDLCSSTVGQAAFDINDYPFDESKTARVINFVEYCYSYKVNMRSNYGLYIYLYNPEAINFNIGTLSNKIQLAVSYNTDGIPDDYDKFSLKFCSVSTESNYSRLFYKFRVIDKTDSDGKYIIDRLNSNERRYDVSGIELVTRGANNAVDYKVGAAYKFTGYAKGYGPAESAESNLAVAVEELETISLDVRNAFFRTGLSNLGADHQNQLDSVYFAVDNTVLEKYGKLQRIKAEWYEYKTTPIVVTESSTVYNNSQLYLGDIIPYGQFNTDIDRSLFYRFRFESVPGGGVSLPMADWGWNGSTKAFCAVIESIYLMFKTDNIEAYDPYASKSVVGGVESNVLYNRIKAYDKTYRKGVLPIKDRTISADLFEDTVDSDRIRGYNLREFDSDVNLDDLLSYNDGDSSFWDKWEDFGFWNTIFGDMPDLDDRYTNIAPIYAVEDSDLQGSLSDVSKRLLIGQELLSDFTAYRTAEAASTLEFPEGKTTFLFRFAASDYFSGALTIYKDSLNMWSDEAYFAQETVFMDFDIIQLTFNRDGVYHVIPVVSNPIDIVNALTPPLVFAPELPDWMRWLMLAVLIVLVLILLIYAGPVFNVIAKIIGFIFKIVLYPFKLLGKALKKAGKGGG